MSDVQWCMTEELVENKLLDFQGDHLEVAACTDKTGGPRTADLQTLTDEHLWQVPATFYPVVLNGKRSELRFHLSLKVDLRSSSTCFQSQTLSHHYHAHYACYRYQGLIQVTLYTGFNAHQQGCKVPKTPMRIGKASSYQQVLT